MPLCGKVSVLLMREEKNVQHIHQLFTQKPCSCFSLFLFFPQEQPEAVTPTTELEMDNMDTFLERLPPSGKMTKTESLIISSNRSENMSRNNSQSLVQLLKSA